MAKRKLRRIKQQPGAATETIKHFLEGPNNTRKVNRHKLQFERSPGASVIPHPAPIWGQAAEVAVCFLTPEQLKLDEVPKTKPHF